MNKFRNEIFARMAEGLSNDEIIKWINSLPWNELDSLPYSGIWPNLLEIIREMDKELPDFDLITSGIEQLKLAELEVLGRTVGRLLQESRAKEKVRLKEAPPEELLPNWGLYGEGEIYDEITEVLNYHGVNLIIAIRDGSDEKISTAMRILREAQLLHAKDGANDTEGREAIWELVKNACLGTLFDPDKLWDKYY